MTGLLGSEPPEVTVRNWMPHQVRHDNVRRSGGVWHDDRQPSHSELGSESKQAARKRNTETILRIRSGERSGLGCKNDPSIKGVIQRD
jgi:hypothetical protein